MELLVESELVPESRLTDLQQEANELTAILVTCSKNAKAKVTTKAVDAGKDKAP